MTDHPIAIAAFITAVRDMNQACNGLGIKKPRSINFANGVARNIVSEAAEAHRLAGLTQDVKTDTRGVVSIDGVELKIQY